MSDRPERILLVEDDTAAAGVLRDAFAAQGWNVKHVDNAFRIVKTVGAFEPDLILMDITMPGFSGESAARLLQQLAERGSMGQVPLVILSGLENRRLVELKESMHALGYIQKAQPIDQVVDGVRLALRAARTRRIGA